MPHDTIPRDPDVDEYLWPLTGDVIAVDWESLAEALRGHDSRPENAARGE